MRALGILELCGYSTALLAADSMCKAADIRIVAIDFNKPAAADLDKIPLLAQIKFVGRVDDVKAAIAAGISKAENYNSSEEILGRVIPNYDEGLTGLIKISKVKKDKRNRRRT